MCTVCYPPESGWCVYGTDIGDRGAEVDEGQSEGQSAWLLDGEGMNYCILYYIQ